MASWYNAQLFVMLVVRVISSARGVTMETSQCPFLPSETWTGGYRCPQGVTLLALEILDTSYLPLMPVCNITSVFNFTSPSDGCFGSYWMKGSVSTGGLVKFTPTGVWIENPCGYGPIGLNGSIRSLFSSLRSYAGNIAGNPGGCSFFSVTLLPACGMSSTATSTGEQSSCSSTPQISATRSKSLVEGHHTATRSHVQTVSQGLPSSSTSRKQSNSGDSASLSLTKLSTEPFGSLSRTSSISHEPTMSATCLTNPQVVETALMSFGNSACAPNRSYVSLGAVMHQSSIEINFVLVEGFSTSPTSSLASVRPSSTFGDVLNISSDSTSDGNASSLVNSKKQQYRVIISFKEIDRLTISLTASILLVVRATLPITGPCIPDGYVTHQVFVATLSPLVTVSALQRAVSNSNRGAVSASALAGNPVGALTMTGVMSLLAMDQCEFSDVDPLDPSVSPLGFAVGPEVGQYNRGAAVAALGVILASSVLLLGTAAVLRRRLITAQLRFPSAMMIVVGVFHQGLATVSVSLIRGATRPSAAFSATSVAGDVALGVAGLLTCVAICAYALLATTVGLKRTCRIAGVKEVVPLPYERRVPLLPLLVKVSSWTQHWEEVSGDGWKRRHLLLIDNLSRPWWTAVELASAMLQGIVLGVRLNDEAVCTALVAVLVVLTGAILAGSAYTQPYGAALDNMFLVLSKLASFVIAVLVLICYLQADNTCSTALVVASIATCLSVTQTTLQAIFTIVLLLRFAKSRDLSLCSVLQTWISSSSSAEKQPRTRQMTHAHSHFVTQTVISEVTTQRQEEVDSSRQAVVDSLVLELARRAVEVQWDSIARRGFSFHDECLFRLLLLVKASAARSQRRHAQHNSL